MKKWNQYSLFLILLISGCLVTGAGYAGQNTIYASYSREAGWMTPGLSLVFQGMKDGIYPWELLAPQDKETVAILTDGADRTKDKLDPSVGEDQLLADASKESGPEKEEELQETEAVGSVSQNLPIILAPEGETGPKYDRFGNLLAEGDVAAWGGERIQGTAPETEELWTEEEKPIENEPQEGESFSEPEDTQATAVEGLEETAPESHVPGQIPSGAQKDGPYEFVPVTADYFNDALFIGDSRTVGLSEYGGFQPETTFYAATSMTIYQVFRTPKRVAQLTDGSKATIEEALMERKFGKIYLMLGINEMGNGTAESFFTTYAETVNHIRMLQPQAIIFVQGIMRVGKGKSSSDAVFNNARIDERNRALAAMSNGKDIFYLEINDVLCDENGDLITQYTFDQIHLKAKYYQLWKDYLFAHGIVRE